MKKLNLSMILLAVTMVFASAAYADCTCRPGPQGPDGRRGLPGPAGASGPTGYPGGNIEVKCLSGAMIWGIVPLATDSTPITGSGNGFTYVSTTNTVVATLDNPDPEWVFVAIAENFGNSSVAVITAQTPTTVTIHVSGTAVAVDLMGLLCFNDGSPTSKRRK